MDAPAAQEAPELRRTGSIVRMIQIVRGPVRSICDSQSYAPGHASLARLLRLPLSAATLWLGSDGGWLGAVVERPADRPCHAGKGRPGSGAP